MKITTKVTAILLSLFIITLTPLAAEVLHFVYVSDTHYGREREFRGEKDVPSQQVNRAMIATINSLPSRQLPQDGGVGEGEKIDFIEAILNTGDIACRMEEGILQATESWSRFESDWTNLVTLTTQSGATTPHYISAGNHEASNAIGLYKLVQPTDATPMVEIYNCMPGNKTPISVDEFDFERDRIHFSVVMGGVRFLFVALWPDSREREWIKHEIEQNSNDEPILIFSHDAAKVEVKHLRSPYKKPKRGDRFEQILSDTSSVRDVKLYPAKEVDELAAFLRANPLIKGYFHGDDNYHEFYTFCDFRYRPVIPAFRVDSPMKGKYSRDDESLLSYIFLSLDTETKILTARQVLWNTPEGIQWGEVKSIDLK